MLPVVLAVALLAASPVDTSLRVPGTTLRFGLGDSVLTARGFPAAEGGHKGAGRFFGLPCEAVLETADGGLAQATFEVAAATRVEIAYVEDQLAAMGYRRRCERLDPGSSSCAWSGRAHVRLDVNDGAVTAVVTARPPDAPLGDPAGLTASLAPAAPRPASRTAPLAPDTLTVPLAGRASRLAAAEVVRSVPPRYPPAAREAGLQGRVWVMATVGTDGRVSDAVVHIGIRELNDAALEAVRGYEFRPRTLDGVPCRYRVLVPVPFTLH